MRHLTLLIIGSDNLSFKIQNIKKTMCSTMLIHIAHAPHQIRSVYT